MATRTVNTLAAAVLGAAALAVLLGMHLGARADWPASVPGGVAAEQVAQSVAPAQPEGFGGL